MVVLELLIIVWKEKCSWNKIKGLRIKVLSNLNDLVEQIFASNLNNILRITIDYLIHLGTRKQLVIIASDHDICIG